MWCLKVWLKDVREPMKLRFQRLDDARVVEDRIGQAATDPAATPPAPYVDDFGTRVSFRHAALLAMTVEEDGR